MEIKEYTEYRAEEILPLYTAIGWTAYTENMASLEQGYRHSLPVLAAYENEKLLGLVRVVGMALRSFSFRIFWYTPNGRGRASARLCSRLCRIDIPEPGRFS